MNRNEPLNKEQKRKNQLMRIKQYLSNNEIYGKMSYSNPTWLFLDLTRHIKKQQIPKESIHGAIITEILKIGKIAQIDFKHKTIWMIAKSDEDAKVMATVFETEKPEGMIKAVMQKPNTMPEPTTERKPEEKTYYSCDFKTNNVECGKIATYEMIADDIELKNEGMSEIDHYCQEHGDKIKAENTIRWGYKSIRHEPEGVVFEE